MREEGFVLDSISYRHHVTRRGGLIAAAALLAVAWLSACGTQQASSTGSPAAASAAPTKTAASNAAAPGVAALTGIPASCSAGASEAAISTAVGKQMKLVSEQPSTGALTCWYSPDGQGVGGVGPVSMIYNMMDKVPSRADFDHVVAAFRSGGTSTIEEISGLGDFGIWAVINLPGYATIYQVAASKGKVLVAFGVASLVATGDRPRMTALVHALLG
jgi:hypothetical protein